MLSERRAPTLDLLVVGGLTIDRFADGRVEPGGSVVHIARAAARRGVRLGIVTAAGSEPVALQALAELRRLARVVAVARHPETTTFRHDEADGHRELALDRVGGETPSRPDALAGVAGRVVLFAPVAGEVNVQALHALDPPGRRRGALLQGWVRTLTPGADVRPRPLASLDGALLAALARLDLIVASRDDLAAEAPEPARQVAALRRAVGLRPTLIVTDGTAGAWIAAGEEVAPPRHHPVARRVSGVSTVGAGDLFGAFVLTDAALATHPHQAVARAMAMVADELERRGGR